MEFRFTAERIFDASHTEDACSIGPRLHGHRWRISVSTYARFDLNKGRLNPSTLDSDLTNLLSEVHGRDLNEMLPGTHTMPENIAAWVMERLSLQHRTLYKVKVWQDEAMFITVRREVRA